MPANSRLVVDPPLRTEPPSREDPLSEPDPPRGAALRPVASPPLLLLPLGRDCPLLALLRCGARSTERIGAMPKPDEDGVDGLEEEPIEPPLIPPPLDLLVAPDSAPPPPRLTAVPPVELPPLLLRDPADPLDSEPPDGRELPPPPFS